MSAARSIVALLRSHIDGHEERFLSVATQLAAHEARQGHGKLAQELRELIDATKGMGATVARRGAGPVPLAQPKGELSGLLAARYSDIRLSSMVLAPELEDRLARVHGPLLFRSRHSHFVRRLGRGALAARRPVGRANPAGSKPPRCSAI